MSSSAPMSSSGVLAAQELLALGRATTALSLPQYENVLEVYQSARRFFSQSEELRRACMLPFDCGYVPFGREHSGDKNRPDQVEYFVCSPRMQTLVTSIPSESARALHTSMMRVFDDLEACAETIARIIEAKTTGRACTDRLCGGLRRWSRLEVHQARTLEPGAMINEPHEDGHFLTFAHADAPGLEIELGGCFVPAERPATSMLVMPGSALTLLTGGEIAPLRHRVRASRYTSPRLSLLFFADIAPRLCTPWRTTRVNANVDIGDHVFGSYRRFGVNNFESD